MWSTSFRYSSFFYYHIHIVSNTNRHIGTFEAGDSAAGNLKSITFAIFAPFSLPSTESQTQPLRGPDAGIQKVVDSLLSFPEDNSLKFIHIKFHLSLKINVVTCTTSSVSGFDLTAVASVLSLPKFSNVNTLFVSINGKILFHSNQAIPTLELIRYFEERIDVPFVGWKREPGLNSLRKEVQLSTIQEWVDSEEIDTYKMRKMWEHM
jgi:hypothetical protein